MKKHIPNTLTLLRIALLPCLIFTIYEWGPSYRSFLFFSIIAVTDYLDGHLARKWKVESDFGAFMDPAADKFLVCMVLIVLAIQNQSALLSGCAMIVIGRELLMSMLREWCAKNNAGNIVSVDRVGKAKTAFQLLALSLLLLPCSLTYVPGLVCLTIATGLTLLSLANYVTKLVQALMAKKLSVNANSNTSYQ